MDDGDEGAINETTSDGGGSGMRPIFLGNLSHGATSSDIEQLFRNPVNTPSASRGGGRGGYNEAEEGMAASGGGGEVAPFDLERVVSYRNDLQ